MHGVDQLLDVGSTLVRNLQSRPIFYPEHFEGLVEGDLLVAVNEAASLNVEIRMNPDFADKGGHHGIVGKPNVDCGSARKAGTTGNA